MSKHHQDHVRAQVSKCMQDLMGSLIENTTVCRDSKEATIAALEAAYHCSMRVNQELAQALRDIRFGKVA